MWLATTLISPPLSHRASELAGTAARTKNWKAGCTIDPNFTSRADFLAIAARVMRRIMVGRARDGALYFGDITAEDSAAMLDVSVHKVNRQMPMAQAWLRRELEAAS